MCEIFLTTVEFLILTTFTIMMAFQMNAVILTIMQRPVASQIANIIVSLIPTMITWLILLLVLVVLLCTNQTVLHTMQSAVAVLYQVPIMEQIGIQL